MQLDDVLYNFRKYQFDLKYNSPLIVKESSSTALTTPCAANVATADIPATDHDGDNGTEDGVGGLLNNQEEE